MMELIPGLPDQIVHTHILCRIRWHDLRSLLCLNKTWRSALSLQPASSETTCQAQAQQLRKANLAIIHPLKSISPPPPPPPPPHSQPPSYGVSIYDSENKRWEHLPPIPGLPFGAPMAARCVFSGGRLFILGGRNPVTWEFMSDVFSMEIQSSTSSFRKRVWTRCSRMKTARSSFACVAIADKIVVAGGQGESSLALASAEVYDLRWGRWEAIPDLNLPRNECVGAIYKEQITVVGGYTSSACDTWCLEDSDFVATRWVTSAEAIHLGSKRWRSVGAAPLREALVQASAPLILSAPLQFLHRRFVRNCYGVCGKKWAVVEGRIMMQSMTDEGKVSLVLAAVIDRANVFGTRYVWKEKGNDDDAELRLSLCEGSYDPCDNLKWKDVACPFEIGCVPITCCVVGNM